MEGRGRADGGGDGIWPKPERCDWQSYEQTYDTQPASDNLDCFNFIIIAITINLEIHVFPSLSK